MGNFYEDKNIESVRTQRCDYIMNGDLQKKIGISLKIEWNILYVNF